MAIADSSVVKSTPGAAEEALVLHFLATQFWWNSKVECAVGVDREAESDAAMDIDDLSLYLALVLVDRSTVDGRIKSIRLRGSLSLVLVLEVFQKRRRPFVVKTSHLDPEKCIKRRRNVPILELQCEFVEFRAHTCLYL